MASSAPSYRNNIWGLRRALLEDELAYATPLGERGTPMFLACASCKETKQLDHLGFEAIRLPWSDETLPPAPIGPGNLPTGFRASLDARLLSLLLALLISDGSMAAFQPSWCPNVVRRQRKVASTLASMNVLSFAPTGRTIRRISLMSLSSRGHSFSWPGTRAPRVPTATSACW